MDTQRLNTGIRTLLVIVALALGACGSAPPRAPESPLVPRLVDSGEPEPIVATITDLLNYGQRTTPRGWVDVRRHTLPNGLSIAMLPLFVDWEMSQLEGENPYVIVRNVTVRGNPIEGRVLLATVRVPMDALRSVEWCNIVARNSNNNDTVSGHGQTRFIFDPDRRPVVLDEEGNPDETSPYMDDMILSWEAWRPPLVHYNIAQGLDPEAYTLSLPAYSGSQRMLMDALRNQPWECYPLALPETPDAMMHLLITNLAMGDSFARRVIQSLVADGQVAVPDEEALSLMFTEEKLEQIRNVYSLSRLPEDPLIDLMGQADLSYQLLERSCITQSLTALQLSLVRTHRNNGLGEPPTLQIVPEKLPPWIEELGTASTGEMLYRAPGLLLFIARNNQVLPGNAYRILEDAGLLRRDEEGEPVVYYYHVESNTPYGELRNNMM